MTAAVGLLNSLFHGKTEATDLLAIDLLSLLPSLHVQGVPPGSAKGLA